MPVSSPSRREFLRRAGAGLLTATLPVAVDAPAAADADFHFLAVNDLHYRDARCRPWLEAAIAQMKAESTAPSFLLISGDLVENGKAEQFVGIKAILKGLGLPYYVTIGNHDYAPGDLRGDYEGTFPGRLNYRFESHGWHFVGLDTTQGTRYQNTDVAQATIAYLQETLPAIPRGAPLVVFTHFPLGMGAPMRPTNADAVLECLSGHNLRAAFSGHFHGFTEKRWREAVLTTDRCCSFARANHDGTRPKGYFVCRARAGEIARTFVEVPHAG